MTFESAVSVAIPQSLDFSLPRYNACSNITTHFISSRGLAVSPDRCVVCRKRFSRHGDKTRYYQSWTSPDRAGNGFDKNETRSPCLSTAMVMRLQQNRHECHALILLFAGSGMSSTVDTCPVTGMCGILRVHVCACVSNYRGCWR